MESKPFLNTLHTPTIADVLDGFGVWGVLDPSIVPLNKIEEPIFGKAYTVRWTAVRKPKNIMNPQPSTWEDVKQFLVPDVNDAKGMIYVAGVDGGLLRHLALAGGFSATDFSSRGFAGMILGGAIRDAHVVCNLKMPIWGTNFTPADTQGNFKIAEVGGTCNVGGVLIKSNDFIFADKSGCVVIPAEISEEVIHAALEIEGRESELLARIESGETLWDVVHDLGRI